MDYPNIRRSTDCPLCHGPKDLQLVICWPCYREHDAKNGLDYLIVETLEKTETYLARGGSAHLHWKQPIRLPVCWQCVTRPGADYHHTQADCPLQKEAAAGARMFRHGGAR